VFAATQHGAPGLVGGRRGWEDSCGKGAGGGLFDGLDHTGVYNRVIDSYRMRIEDDYVYGRIRGLYADEDPIPDFRRFLDMAEAKKLLPVWWDREKRAACESLAVKSDGNCYLGHAVEKPDIQEKYSDQLMPMKIRRRCRNGSPFSLMPKPPLGGWHQRSPAQARSTQSWQDDTSRSCEEQVRVSPSRPGGAPPIRASQATKRPTSGQRSQQKNRKHQGWSGYREERARCHSPGLLRTSSVRSRRRNGTRPASGPVNESPLRNTECRARSSLTRQWPEATRGSPQGFTRSRPGTALLGST